MSDQPKAETSTDNTQHSKETSMLPPGFETAIQISERLEANALDGAAIRIGQIYLYLG
jgi:hypothetical protein